MENQVAQERKNNAGVLYLAFELSHKKWKLGFSDGKERHKFARCLFRSGDLEALGRGNREGEGADWDWKNWRGVRSCYEAGREGFWLHRALEGMGIENHGCGCVIDRSESTATASQDGPDGRGKAGATVGAILARRTTTCGVWSGCPSPEAEDSRQLHRGLRSAQGGTQATPRADSVAAVTHKAST